MPQQSTVTLKRIFSEVVANLAFMFTDDEEADPSLDARWLETTIGYEGPMSGTLRFHCTREFSELLTSNLLGVDPEDDHATSEADDAVKEFMNILCGHYITALHGTEDVFNVTIPQIRELPEPPALVDDSDPDTATLSVNGHHVQLSYVPWEDHDAV
ncbi:MAG: chemotaxis protein CheX [Phycisphaerae bacterium]